MSSILGLNAYHGDSAACLFVDGKLIAAAEEERFRRIKHWAGLPTQAIDYCLREGGLTISEIDHIAVNRKPGVNNLRRFMFVLRHRPDPRLMWQKVRNIRKAATVKEALEAHYGTNLRAEPHHIEHHHAHLASAYLVSGFEEAACLSVDGFGDFASTSFGLGHANGIEIQDRVYFPHSLGIFFSAVTQFIGFPHYGDEYKVMGLAPYGEPKFVRQMSGLVEIANNGKFKLDLRYFRHHTANVSYSWNNCAPEVGKLYRDEMAELLGPPRDPDAALEQRHKDLARSAQIVYEEAFFALLLALHRRYPVPNLALSGGCAMNSVANGKVYLRTPFRKMYLPAAAGDAGGAIGAACVVQSQLDKSRGQRTEVRGQRAESRSQKSEVSVLTSDLRPPTSAYIGPHFSNDEIEHLLGARRLLDPSLPVGQAFLPAEPIDSGKRERLPHISEHPASPLGISPLVGLPAEPIDPGKRERLPYNSNLRVLRIDDSAELCERTARAIAEGLVVGWFQGRMEWGPRALGNRSILCDARRADMKDILNAKIKRRESFRPFAPSILREAVGEWFEQEDDVPFMMQVFQVREEKRALIPAVTHVDGSGRLQTVHRETNPLYHKLISDFCSLTSVPLILNTSFNENEPVVCRPEEALDCFLRTRMDVLVLGSFFVERKS
jgi:predicted NodU family carbamoyl transferase